MVDTKEQEAMVRRQAVENIRGWMEWYMDTYPSICPTRQALADFLGITGGRVTQFLDRRENTDPSLRFLLGARKITGGSIDLLLQAPPERPKTTGR